MFRFYSSLVKNKVVDNITYTKGMRINGYLIKRVKKINELNLSAIELFHEKTQAQHLHLIRKDDNINSFAVFFKTLPNCNTGIAHILEHLTLCGSQKYPCPDPFMKMLSRSLATTMNASTFYDSTSYFYSTVNDKDFENLLNVYLDAVFNPLLKNYFFMQEGYRLEQEDLKDKNSKLKIKGVVFNEMKDIYSCPDNIFALNLLKKLLPSTIYSNDFGGHPFNIPDLDIDKVKNFHKTYYNPKNAKFFTYGKLPIEFYLSKIDNILNNIKINNNLEFTIENQPKWDEPKSFTIFCPQNLFESNIDNQVVTCKAFLLLPVSEDYENFLLNILSNLLIDGQNSPFFKNLIDSNLGKNYSPLSGYNNNTKQSFFSIGLSGIKEEDVSKVQKIINETFIKAEKDSFSKERIDSILHSIELNLKHFTSSFGLNLIFSLGSCWNYDADIFENLNITQKLERLKNDLIKNPNLFRDLINKHFINNKHYIELTMKPSIDYLDQFKQNESKILEKKINSLNHSDKEKIFQDCLELEEKIKNQQNIDVLPCLNIDTDVSKKIPYPTSIEQFKLNDLNNVQVAVQNTNGLIYFRGMLKLNLNEISEELLIYLPIFCNVITELGAGELNRNQMSQKIELKTSGLSTCLHFKNDHLEGKNCDLNILLSSYCLEKNLNEMLGLWERIFNSLKLDEDPQYLIQLIKIQAAKSVQNLTYSGHLYSMLRSSHNINLISNLKEKLTGINYIQNLNKISENLNFETLINNLNDVMKIVFNKKNMNLALNAESNFIQNSLKNYEKFLNNLSNTSSVFTKTNSTYNFEFKNNIHEHYILQSNSNYVSKSIQSVPFLHKDYAKYNLLTKLLTQKYLHREIREIRSAYGAGQKLFSNGILSFYSYRDPNIQTTIDVFNKSFDWVLNSNNFTDQDINEAKLEILKEINKPVTASNHGMKYFLKNINDEMIQNYINNVFKINKKDIINLIQTNLGKINEKVGITCLGPSSEETKKTPWILLK